MSDPKCSFRSRFLAGVGGNNQSNSNSNNSNTSTTPQPNDNNKNEETTTLKVNMGTECKTMNVPKLSCYKELTQCIKESFGLNTKSVLNIKCENNDGDMFNVASDCHLRKAYRNQDQDELRLVVKEVQPCKSSLFSSLFSGFYDCNKSTPTTTTTPAPTTTIPTTPDNHTSLLTGIMNPQGVAVNSFVSTQPSLAQPTPVQVAPTFFKKDPSTPQLDANLQPIINNITNNSTPTTVHSNNHAHHGTHHNNHFHGHHHHIGHHGHHLHNHHHGFHHHHNSLTHVSPMFRSSPISFTHLNQPNLGGLSSTFSNLSINQHFSTKQPDHHHSTPSSSNEHHSQPMAIPQGTTTSKRNSPSPTSSLNNKLSSPLVTLATAAAVQQPQQSKYSIFASSTKNTDLLKQSFSNINNNSINNNSNIVNNTNNNINNNLNNLQEPKSLLNRNESFEFMAESDNEDNGSTLAIDDTDDESSVSSSVSSVSSMQSMMPMGGCPFGNLSKAPKEVTDFIGTVTKLFCRLRTSNDHNEKREIKAKITEMIQNATATMPFIKGMFPQLGQLALSDCAPCLPAPPNTPPPSPSGPSHMADMATKEQQQQGQQVSVFQVSADVPIEQLQSHLSLQSKIESMCAEKWGKQQQSSPMNGPPPSPHPLPGSTGNNHHLPSSSSSSSSTAMQYGPSQQQPTNKSCINIKFEGPTVHRGSTCTQCTQSPIIGTLFHCSACPSFMFCESCRQNKQISECINATSNNLVHRIVAVTKAMKSCNLATTPREITASPKRGCPYSRKKFKCTFSVKVLGDVTLPFGSTVKPNEQHIKTWRLQNTGTQLPKDCLIVRICGNKRLAARQSVSLPPAAPGEIFTISVPIIIPTIPNTCNEFIVGEYWRVCTGDGFYFGDQFWISLVVKGNQQQDQQETDVTMMNCDNNMPPKITS